MYVNFKKLTETALIPQKNLETDAGVDFFADEEVIIPVGEHREVSTGIGWSAEMYNTHFHAYMQIKCRSGLAFNHSIEASTAGVIDQEYRGDIKVMLYNNSDVEYTVSQGDKIAQGVVHLIPKFTVREVDDLDGSTRGTDGFGSSGN